MTTLLEIDGDLEARIRKMILLQEQLESEQNTQETYEQLVKIESSIAMTVCSIYRSDRIHELLKQSPNSGWENAKRKFLAELK